MYFIRFEKFSVIISSNTFSTSFSLSSFSETSTMYMLVSLVVSQLVPWALFTFLQYFSFYSSLFTVFIVLYSGFLILSSAYSNMNLNPSSEFFISVIVLFSSTILFVLVSCYVFYLFIAVSILFIYHFS